jgi:hypothetical protein
MEDELITFATLAAVVTKNAVFWDVTPCNVVDV